MPTWSDNTVLPGVDYVYRVKATNAAGDSAYSAEAPVSTPEATHAPAGFLGRATPITAAANLVPVIVVANSFTSGETPMLVNVSALGTTMDGSTEPYDELEYSWDFGDETGEVITDPRTGLPTDLNDTQKGPEAAYVYRRAGTYTITLTVRAWNGAAYVTNTATQEITVAKWAGDTRYIDAINGLDTHDGKDPRGFALANAAYTASSRTLTKTGAFAAYTFDDTADDATYEGEASSLNWIAITSGTGFTAGLYKIASKTSDDAIVLAADARLPGADAANVASSSGPKQTLGNLLSAYWLNGDNVNHRRLLLRAGQTHATTNINGGIQIQTTGTQIRAGAYGPGDDPICSGVTGASNRVYVRGTGNHVSRLAADVGSGACQYGLGIAGTAINSFIDQCSTTGTCSAGGSGAWVNADGATSIGLAYWRCDLQANGKHGIYFYMAHATAGYGAVVGCTFGGNGLNIILDHHIYANEVHHFLAALNDFGPTTLRNFCINGNCVITLGEKTRYWCYDRNDFTGTQNATDFSSTNNAPTTQGHFRNVVVIRNDYHTGQIGDQYLGLTPWCAERIAFRENNFYGPIREVISQQANTADLDLVFERNKVYLAAGHLLEMTSDSIVGITLTDNIVEHTSDGTAASDRLLILPTSHDKLTLSGNQYYAPNMAAKAFRNSTTSADLAFDAWQSFAPEADAVWGDPLWNDPANGDFTTTAPAAPTALTVSNATPGQLSLSWTDNASNETGFKIERSEDRGSTWSLIHTAAVNAVSYTDSGLSAGSTHSYRVCATNNIGDSAYTSTVTASVRCVYRVSDLDPATTYYFRISAANAAGASDPSATATATTQTVAPGTPTALGFNESGSTTPEAGGTTWVIYFTAADNYANLFRVQTAPDNATWSELGTLGDGATAPAPTSKAFELPAVSQLWARVRAENSAGVSAWSTPVAWWTGPAATEVTLTGPALAATGVDNAYTLSFPEGTGTRTSLTFSLDSSGWDGALTVSPEALTLSPAQLTGSFTVRFYEAGSGVLAVDAASALPGAAPLEAAASEAASGFELAVSPAKVEKGHPITLSAQTLPYGSVLIGESVTLSLSVGGFAGSLADASLLFAEGDNQQSTTFTPSAAGTITFAGTPDRLSSPAAVTAKSFAGPQASGLSLTGPATAASGSTQTYSIALTPTGSVAWSTDTITLAVSGGGTLSAASLPVAEGQSSLSFTYTGTAGAHTLSLTSSGLGTDTLAVSFAADLAVSLSLAYVTNSLIRLSWTSSGGSGDLTANLHRSTSAGFAPAAGNLIAADAVSPYDDAAGLQHGVLYRYKLRVSDSLGQSAVSNELAVGLAYDGSGGGAGGVTQPGSCWPWSDRARRRWPWW